MTECQHPGPPSRYAYNRGCKAPACREENRLDAERRRRAAGVRPLRRGTQAPHGHPSRYAYGCRCSSCRRANTNAKRRYRASLGGQ